MGTVKSDDAGASPMPFCPSPNAPPSACLIGLDGCNCRIPVIVPQSAEPGSLDLATELNRVKSLGDLLVALAPDLDELAGACRRVIELRSVLEDLLDREDDARAGLTAAFDRQATLAKRLKSAIFDHAIGRARVGIAADAERLADLVDDAEDRPDADDVP